MKRKRSPVTRLSIMITAVAISFGPARASSEETERAVAVALRLANPDTMNLDERTGLIDASLDYWTDFDGRIPRNSPADAEWLKGELSTTDSARINRAINSVAYAKDRLAEISTLCVDVFRQLKANVGTSKAVELYLWLKSTRCYSSDAGEYLRIAGLSDGKQDGAFKMHTFALVLSTITGKLANSVLNGL